MSNQLEWMIMKPFTSFMMKRPDCTFSRDPTNIKNIHARGTLGLVQKKSIGILAKINSTKPIKMIVKDDEHAAYPVKNFSVSNLQYGVRIPSRTLVNKMFHEKHQPNLYKHALGRLSSLWGARCMKKKSKSKKIKEAKKKTN